MKLLGTIIEGEDIVNKKYVDDAYAEKQDILVSGTNIKTINSESLLGSGDITIAGDNVFVATYGTTTHDDVYQAWQNKKVIVIDTLNAGSSNDSVYVISTVIEDTSSGQLQLLALGRNYSSEIPYYVTTFIVNWFDNTWQWFTTTLAISTDLDGKQDTLVSGTNIKTINNQSILGSGNINVSGGGSSLQNLADGSSPGSVRGVNAKAEDSSYTMGISAFAEGNNTTASGIASHAEGRNTTASGAYDAHAEGFGTTASGESASHAEGHSTTASGHYSHAEGYGTTASGMASHAEGNGTVAQRLSQTTIGAFNILDTQGINEADKGKYVFIIGNGTADSARSNALGVTWGGDIEASGNVKDGTGNILANKADTSDLPGRATESTLGTVKLNPSESITLNSSGQLDVGGRLGQMSNSTGIYSPKTINPAAVGNGSFLLTEGSGLKLGNKSLAVVTGISLNLKSSASAGTTTYLVNNTYENRIICAGILGGVLALNESTAAENYVNVTSVTIGGYAPTTANYWTASGDITIKTNASINPNSSITSVRPYATGEAGFSNLFVGQLSGGKGGASIVVGQKVFSYSGNACAIVGASMYNTGNGNALFGRQHISKKNRSFLAGTGHDTTNGPSEGVAAIGQWSDIKSTTSFAIGNGTSATDRSNSFEVDTAGDAIFNGYIVLKSPNGTSYSISVDNSGNLVTAAI